MNLTIPTIHIVSTNLHIIMKILKNQLFKSCSGRTDGIYKQLKQSLLGMIIRLVCCGLFIVYIVTAL